ncbi:Variant-specific surface protein [Giardia duodenalis]|uniref:Variant-specific surface protein n=1 Tax=Giardia intestinalis TaxID=5741 RepID=V6TP49_GIAIN|nr:Variant-specific surface protein [Giardia intestinalis]
MFLLISCLIVNALAATCSASQTNCVEGKCETIGTTEICTQCKQNYVPINGVCEAAASNAKCKAANGSDNADQTCKKCLLQTFMFKGGCYDKAGETGNLICTDAASGTTGVCATCKEADGFFRNPDAADTTDSCILCNDTTGVTIGESNNAKTYTGITNCVKCTKPDQLSAPGTKAATCTECASNLYLKTDSSATPATSCVTAETCKTGYFPNDNADSKKKCLACNTAANGGIDKCAECSLLTPASRAGAILITCTKCSTNSLSPLKDACLTSCPAGTYETGSPNKVCTPCHTSCAGCKDDNTAASCTACYPGSVLSYGSDNTKGTCIAECTGKYLENCADGQCTASIAGSKYCSKCKSGYVPVDGMCVLADKTRAPPTGCTPNSNDGVCTTCTEKYFLESGGCYQAEKFPGNTLCTAAASGKCTSCANGQQVDGTTGSCPACDSTCKTCSAKNNPAKCSACFSGYYLDSANACKKCSETSGNIQGVANCISCEKPSSGNGAVTCYVKTSGGGSGDNSTGGDSGPNLSSGAIAGISVAVIVVVGGLVGFLCWWFICRGKA